MGKREKEKISGAWPDKNLVARQFSSGGVVFRKFQSQVRWLVTRSNPSQKYPQDVWRLPKGWIDEGEKPEEAALREVREEGGTEAKIVKKIETVKYFFTTPGRQKVLKFVTFYLMEFVKDLPGGFGEETSEIKWLPFEKAQERLSYQGEKQILTKARKILVL